MVKLILFCKTQNQPLIGYQNLLTQMCGLSEKFCWTTFMTLPLTWEFRKDLRVYERVKASYMMPSLLRFLFSFLYLLCSSLRPLFLSGSDTLQRRVWGRGGFLLLKHLWAFLLFTKTEKEGERERPSSSPLFFSFPPVCVVNGRGSWCG